MIGRFAHIRLGKDNENQSLPLLAGFLCCFQVAWGRTSILVGS